MSSLKRLAVAVVIVVAACALAAPVAVIPRPPKQDDEWTMPAGADTPGRWLVEYPRAKGMDALAELLFSGPEAPFDMSRRPWVRGDDRWVLLRRGGLLASSSFRSTVLNGLRARDVQFSLTTTVSGCEFIFKGEENLWHFRPPEIPRAPDELGIVRQVRFCNLVAEFLCETSQLGPLKRKAQFRIDDPIEKRDKGTADWIALIQGVERRSTVD